MININFSKTKTKKIKVNIQNKNKEKLVNKLYKVKTINKLDKGIT